MSDIFKFATTLALYASLYQGFLTALTKAVAVSLPAAPQTIAVALFAPAILFLSIALGKLNTSDICILLVASGFILAKTLGLEIMGSQIDYTQVFWYFMYLFLFIGLRNSNPLTTAEATKTIFRFGILSTVVAIAQFLGSEALPSYLIEPPFTHGTLLDAIYSYDLIDTVVRRPNGLFSNPIVFAAFLVMIFEIGLIKLSQKQSFSNILIVLLVSSVILISLSRAAIFGLVLVLFVYILKSGRIFLLIIMVILSAFMFLQTSEGSSLVVEILTRINERFAGIDAFAQASNAKHLSDKQNAIDYILGSPLIGYSFGFFANEGIITDGAAFILSLEFGVPITILIFSLVTTRTRRIAHDEICSRDFPAYSIFILLIFSLINSSLIDKAIVPILIILLTIQTAHPSVHRHTI